MDKLFALDWHNMFSPTSSVLEMIVRGTITYWFCYGYIRYFRRGAGQLSISDLLLVTLISDAAQNSMAGTYESITEGVALVGTLVFWDYALNWLGYRNLFFKKVSNPDPIPLVVEGVFQRQNMKREMIAEDELLGLLRENGVDDVLTVKTCYIEGSGNLSVIEKK